jgi:hypothetical protein
MAVHRLHRHVSLRFTNKATDRYTCRLVSMLSRSVQLAPAGLSDGRRLSRIVRVVRHFRCFASARPCLADRFAVMLVNLRRAEDVLRHPPQNDCVPIRQAQFRYSAA